MLTQVVKQPVQTLTLLQNGDRTGSVTWIDSGDVKTYFISLKEGLLAAFSPKVQDLNDETVEGDNQPVRNILTFYDPALSEERLTFVRVRERLYEFHTVLGKEQQMTAVINALTLQ